jgi:hypothetical protein
MILNIFIIIFLVEGFILVALHFITIIYFVSIMILIIMEIYVRTWHFFIVLTKKAH